MANAGSLYVSIFARTSGFHKGLKRARKDLGDFAAGAARAGAIAGAALATGAGFLIRDTMKDMAEAGWVSDRLGLPTEDLVAMREAAQDAGVDFSQLTRGIEKFAVTAGNMGAGGSVSENFFKVSDAITALQSSQQRAALTSAAFGRSQVSLMSFLVGAREKIAAARKENDALGLSFSRIDAAKAQAAEIALGNMKDVLTGIATQAAPTVAGMVIAISEKFIDLSKTGMGAFHNIMNGIGGTVGVVAKLMDWIEGLKSGWYAFQGIVQTSAMVIIAPIAMIGKSLQELINLVSTTNVTFGDEMLNGAVAFGLAAQESGAKMKETWAAFTQGSHAKDAAAWLTGMEQRANELAVALTKTSAAGGQLGGLGDMLKGSSIGQQFKDATRLQMQQGDISRFAIGFSGRQANKNPQIETTNQLLQQILARVGPKAAVAA